MRYSVFVSYRREGGEGFAQMFSEKLQKKRYQVFYDIESIGAGLFDQKILHEIEQADVFLLILTKGALDRCSGEGDWVRTEIAHALGKGKPIIPLFFRGFEFPEKLPEDIEKVALYNGVDIRDMNYFKFKFDQLCSMINQAAKAAQSTKIPAPTPQPPTKPAAQNVDASVASPAPFTQEKVQHADPRTKRGERCFRKGDYLLAAELGHSGALSWLDTNISSYRSQPAKSLFCSKRLTQMRTAYCQGRIRQYTFAYAKEETDLILSRADAMQKFQEAAQMGYIPAQMALADWYMEYPARHFNVPARNFLDKCSKKNPQMAFYWYSRAAEQGVGHAHCELGRLYMSGTGVKKDPKQAIHHFHIAAMKGDRDGQYHLGYCLEHGEGTPADRVQATHWYKLAAAQGHSGAQQALVKLIG